MKVSSVGRTHTLIHRVTLVFGLMSLLCLASYWLALTDIWNETGRPDFWQGEGVAAFEWRWLSILFWPMFAFHGVSLVRSIYGVVRRCS